MIESFGRDMTGDICWKVFRNESAPCNHCTNEQLRDAQGNPAGVCVWQAQNPITGRYYDNRDRAIEWIDGRLVRLQVATDITEFRNMQEQLLQAQKMETVGLLAGGVAHDFNNMLTIMRGFAEMALNEVAPGSSLHRKLEQIIKAANRSAAITQQLLAFARKQTIAPVVLDLNATVEGMLRMLRRLIGEDIELLWKPAGNLWPVMMDPAQLDQILANLCVNARDAIAGVGRLTIETECMHLDQHACFLQDDVVPGDYVMLSFSDTGCGMDQATRAKIFDPFFTTKEVGQGTGLGLPTVYGIVRQNNGFVTVYSEPGQGATFKVYLPRHHADSTADLPAETRKQPPMGRGETILLVEDEPDILTMGQLMLEHLGYRVLLANTPAKARQQAEKHTQNIDLLLTDVIMPEMNGRDLAQELHRRYPNLKILFMSGHTADVIAHRGVLDDGVCFIQKPFSMQELASKVRQTLNTSHVKNDMRPD